VALCSPLHKLLHWLAPAARVSAPVQHTPRASARLPSVLAGACTQPTRRPLRVVRVMEAGQPRSQVGRMVISGRMADVCAELDRLAACEAAHSC
jgi:hypothetical protein